MLLCVAIVISCSSSDIYTFLVNIHSSSVKDLYI
jgi:hypothetical protein